MSVFSIRVIYIFDEQLYKYIRLTLTASHNIDLTLMDPFIFSLGQTFRSRRDSKNKPARPFPGLFPADSVFFASRRHRAFFSFCRATHLNINEAREKTDRDGKSGADEKSKGLGSEGRQDAEDEKGQHPRRFHWLPGHPVAYA